MRVNRLSTSLLLLLCVATAPVQAQTAAETSVKAAIVHKIAKFVEWPRDAFDSKNEPMTFCIVGDDNMLDAISRLGNQKIHNRTIVAVATQDPTEGLDACDVLYLGDDPDREVSEWTSAVAGKPILTFGESGGYGDDGSIVKVMVRRDKVRFEVNLDANEGTGLRIGARLLQLAAAVGGRGGQ